MATTKEQFLAVFEELVAELVEDLRAPELGMPESVCTMTREVRAAPRRSPAWPKGIASRPRHLTPHLVLPPPLLLPAAP
jgi:hypothetical protein